MITREPFYTAEQIRSRLGISTYVLRGRVPPWRDALRMIAEAGIVNLEIIDNRGDYKEGNPSTMKEIVTGSKEFGLSIISFHSRSINFHELGLKKEIERSKRAIGHLLEIGGRVWGTHVKIEHPETQLGYESLAEYYEGEDLSLVIENLHGAQTIQACIEWVDAIGHPQIGMILDLAHERNAFGQNPMTLPGGPTKILRRIGHRLHHIHLQDFVRGREGLPPFEGEIQWVETFNGLNEIGYVGPFLFEPNPHSSPHFADTIRSIGAFPERIVMAEKYAQ